MRAYVTTFAEMRKAANPVLYLKKASKDDHAPTPPPTQAVAMLSGNAPVTREDAAE